MIGANEWHDDRYESHPEVRLTLDAWRAELLDLREQIERYTGVLPQGRELTRVCLRVRWHLPSADRPCLGSSRRDSPWQTAAPALSSGSRPKAEWMTGWVEHDAEPALVAIRGLRLGLCSPARDRPGDAPLTCVSSNPVRVDVVRKVPYVVRIDASVR